MILSYGKSTQLAIAAMSLLAQHYDGASSRKFSATEIAADRNLRPPSVAKILVQLSQAGLVNGTRGPGGGYWLARAPSEISVLDVAVLFERDGENVCPLGRGRCGNGEPCPFHNTLIDLDQTVTRTLKDVTFDIFLAGVSSTPAAPSAPATAARPTSAGRTRNPAPARTGRR
jgi:Rrf2 family transcriptional regulator, iron-sulfur cluster assembly transcription factor